MHAPGNVPSLPRRSRRQFLRDTSLGVAGSAVAASLPSVLANPAQPDAAIRIGVIGCGGRGTGAALDALGADTEVHYPMTGYHTENPAPGAEVRARNVEIFALADLFPDRLDHCRQQLQQVGSHARTVSDDLICHP